MSENKAVEIGARIDRLPATRPIWLIAAASAFGAFFEIYDIALTGFLAPVLVHAGVFHTGERGLFGVNDLAAFAGMTFAGLWIGTLVFSLLADMFGRREVFTYSLVWYGLATAIMGLQSTALAVDLWRFIAAIGVGMQLVTIDCYIAEMMPGKIRGRARALTNSLVGLAVPVCGLLTYFLSTRTIAGVEGWRWLAFVPLIGCAGVWWIRSAMPESPRWLAVRGRVAEAEEIVGRLEAASRSATGAELAPVSLPREPKVAKGESDLWRASMPVLVMMCLFHILQTVGYYGFGNWVPTLLAASGHPVKESLAYSTAIVLGAPAAPLLFFTFADRIERKWQIVIGALLAAICGLLFARQTHAIGLIMLGILTSVSLALMSYGYHVYQGEIFPTRIRARAIGIVYSFSRLSAIFSSFLIAFVLRSGGTSSVFVLIAASLIGVALLIGIFGPRSRGRALEEIA